jgi:hypothetical protein
MYRLTTGHLTFSKPASTCRYALHVSVDHRQFNIQQEGMQRATLPEGIWPRRHAYISQTELLYTYQRQMAVYDQLEVALPLDKVHLGV